ncbi:hypothetical protein VIGAN_01158500, partial [Vigna angularis var. angularis]
HKCDFYFGEKWAGPREVQQRPVADASSPCAHEHPAGLIGEGCTSSNMKKKVQQARKKKRQIRPWSSNEGN